MSGDIPKSRESASRHLGNTWNQSSLEKELNDRADQELAKIEDFLAGQQDSAGKKSLPKSDTSSTNKTINELADNQETDDPREDRTNDPDSQGEETLKAKQQRVEALLFLSRKPQNLRKISELAQLEDATQARTLIGQLNKKYDSVGRAFQIKQVAGGYQMLTRPQFSAWIERLDYLPRPLRLSQPALETLTLVAYRQPIIKAEIEAIRGLASGEMLRQLLELNLIKIAGRSPKLGRPFLYITTREFLTKFGLNSLQELPRQEQLSGTGLPDWPSSDINSDQPKNGSSTPQKEETFKGD